ncbi:hypothetical protein ACP275_08G048400 [Erythranthe tilingii]
MPVFFFLCSGGYRRCCLLPPPYTDPIPLIPGEEISLRIFLIIYFLTKMAKNHEIGAFGWAARDTSGVLSPFNFSTRATGEYDVQFSFFCFSYPVLFLFLLPRFRKKRNGRVMALAEARAAWQRTGNRCLVQEDAKRAPQLAYCSSLPPPCSKPSETGPTTSPSPQDIPPPSASSYPFDRNSSYYIYNSMCR